MHLCPFSPFCSPENDNYYRQSPYSILVNTETKTLSLYEHNTLVKFYPIAIGKPSTPTPKGVFKIINKAINPGGPFGIRWLGLSAPGGDYGIHGTNNPSSIGKAVSNGCIRLHNKDVLEVSNLVGIGTKVTIY